MKRSVRRVGALLCGSAAMLSASSLGAQRVAPRRFADATVVGEGAGAGARVTAPLRRAGGSAHRKRIVLGAVVGAATGAVVTIAWVSHCKALDTHSEGPPCEIGYYILGRPAVLGGALVGALLGHYSGKRSGPASSRTRRNEARQPTSARNASGIAPLGPSTDQWVFHPHGLAAELGR